MKRRWSAIVLTAVLLAGLSACTTKDVPPPSASPAYPASVALPSTPQIQFSGLAIGVLTAPLAGPGAEYRQVANGAQIAAFRFGLDGLKITFQIAADDGTSEGALAAMQTLLDAKVAGVIVAGAGDHLNDALSAAAAAGMPVLLPYDYSIRAAAPIYRTGPSAAALATGLKNAVTSSDVSHPLVITQSGYAATTGWGQALAYTDDPVATAQAAVQAVNDGQADTVVIEAAADVQSAIVNQIQSLEGNKQLPIVLTPQALTPAFSANLGEVADLRGVLMTVGQNTGDAVALQQDAQGQRTSAFLQSVRMAADNPGVKNIFGDGPIAPVAYCADTASHDAVVVLVRAAEKVAAGSAPNMAAALIGLSLSDTDGLVGGPLDFTQPDALGANQIVTLFASSQTPGLRPALPENTTEPLTWVAITA